MNDTIMQEWDPEWKRGWFLVVPLGTMLGLTDVDRTIAQFLHEHHAKRFATTWKGYVNIIQNGEVL